MIVTTDTHRARLERAFETLKINQITPILVLTGSTGVRKWNHEYYQDLATAAGTPTAWVGAHAGYEDLGGAYWDETGRLRYRYSQRLAANLWFWHSSPRCAHTLVTALAQQGLPVSWTRPDGQPGTTADSVRLHLEGAP